MHRFYAPMVDGRPRFSRAQQHQLRHVLRLADGDTVAVFDGSGAEWAVQLAGESGRAVKDIGHPVEPRGRLTLYQALIKPAKFELVLQKGTELGVSRFVPFSSERSTSRPGRADRWRSIVVEAAEQSGRRIVPAIDAAKSFDEAVAEATSQGVPFMPWEGTERPRLSAVHRPARELGLIIGPEGGFSEVEVERARQRGALPVSLGRRILRSETAAIVAVALLMQLNGEI